VSLEFAVQYPCTLRARYSEKHLREWGRLGNLHTRLTTGDTSSPSAEKLEWVENAREEIAGLEVIPANAIMQREPELLEQARALMPRLLLPEIDVLVVEEIGKNISGVGMDSNVTGRHVNGAMPGFTGPKIARIVVLRLTPETHGNAVGIGMADIVTETLFNAIDRNVTYTNALSSGSLSNGRIPIAVPGDEQAVMAAASCVPGTPAKNARIVWIKNTLHLREIAVSENLAETVRKTNGCQLGGVFDGKWL